MNRCGLIHVQVWEALNGPKPTGMELHHLCGVKRCYSPDHLMLLHRRAHLFLEGRYFPRKCSHPLSGHNLMICNEKGESRFRCRRCHDEVGRRWKRANPEKTREMARNATRRWRAKRKEV